MKFITTLNHCTLLQAKIKCLVIVINRSNHLLHLLLKKNNTIVDIEFLPR